QPAPPATGSAPVGSGTSSEEGATATDTATLGATPATAEGSASSQPKSKSGTGPPTPRPSTNGGEEGITAGATSSRATPSAVPPKIRGLSASSRPHTTVPT